MKKYTLIGLVAMTVWITACGKKEQIIQPEYRDLTEAVYASGNIYPEKEYKVFANADGFLTQRLVNPGDVITPNQLLFRLESVMPDARAQAASRIYQQALENYRDQSPALQELSRAVQNAYQKYQLDSLNLVRLKNLAAANAVSKSELDKAQLQANISKNEHLQRKDAYQRTKNQLYVELQNAESNYLVNNKDAENFQVKSQLGGVVYDVYKEQGEAVRRNDPIALVGDPSKVYIRLQVDELDIPKIKVGQEVLVQVDVYKDKLYKAQISKVYPKLNREDQSFRVDASFVGEAPAQFYGLTVEANIIISKRSKVLTIPKSALRSGDSLLVKGPEGEQGIAIKKGAESFDYIEVLPPVTDQTQIIIQ